MSQLTTMALVTRTHLLPSGDFSLYVFTDNTQDPEKPIERVNDPILESSMRTMTQRVPMVLMNDISLLWPVKVLSPTLAAVTQDLTKHWPYPLAYGQGAVPAQRQSRRRKASGAAGQAARTVFT